MAGLGPMRFIYQTSPPPWHQMRTDLLRALILAEPHPPLASCQLWNPHPAFSAQTVLYYIGTWKS